MSRAYQIHLEQIEAHNLHHPSALATEVIQVNDPDLSCRLCYPPVGYHRAFRRFWNEYQDTYFAHRYTQQTVDAHFILTLPRDYNTLRAAARDIVFSCRYNNPHLDPLAVIAALLRANTRFILAPTLPADFEGNIFDPHLEPPAISTPILARVINNLDHLSPITQGTDEELDYRISPTTRSIHTLEPEDLDNFAGPSHTSSLLPYDEDTTQVQFPPRIPLPSSPFSEIRLDQPLTRPDTPPPNPLPRFLQNLNPAQYFRRTPPPVTTQLPVVNELYQANITPNTTPLTTPPLRRQLFIPQPAPTDHQIIEVPQVTPPQPNVLVEQPNQTPNTTPIDPHPLPVQRQIYLPQAEIIEPHIVGAYPKPAVIEPAALEEIRLEEVNLQEQEENPNEELIESEEETSEKEASEEEPEDLKQEELAETEEEPDATVEDPEPEEAMANEALNAAAEAMTALANAMGRGGEKSLMKIDFYRGDGTQDPVTWIEEFERAAKADHWSPARQLELACAYMKDNAQEWLTSLEHESTHFHNEDHDNADVVSFTHIFKGKFSTTKQKATWQKQLFEIKQGTETVDTYISRFKRLRGRVD